MSVQFEPDQLKEKLAALRAHVDIQLIILFGSAVKGARRSQSDLDLAILGKEPLDIVDLTSRVMVLLRTDRVDVVDLRRASPLLAMEVVRGGLLIYEQHPGQYAAFCSLAHRRYVDTAKLREAQKEVIARFLHARDLA